MPSCRSRERRPPRSRSMSSCAWPRRPRTRYGVCFLGSDIGHDGGKLLLSAGAPRALGDDEERMLLALREIVDGAASLPVCAGVSRGHVFAAELGPPYRRAYALMGDCTNVAARLSGQGTVRAHLRRRARCPSGCAPTSTSTALAPLDAQGQATAAAGLGRRLGDRRHAADQRAAGARR